MESRRCAVDNACIPVRAPAENVHKIHSTRCSPTSSRPRQTSAQWLWRDESESARGAEAPHVSSWFPNCHGLRCDNVLVASRQGQSEDFCRAGDDAVAGIVRERVGKAAERNDRFDLDGKYGHDAWIGCGGNPIFEWPIKCDAFPAFEQFGFPNGYNGDCQKAF